MPLNLKDTDEIPSDEGSTPQPILHTPEERKSFVRKIVLAFFVIAVLGSASFLIYVFTSLKTENQPVTKTGLAQQAETTKVTEQETSGLSSQTEKGTSAISSSDSFSGNLSQQRMSSGRYTIFIASLTDRASAEEEVGRWNEAGYQASVVEAMGHFRVALGQYSGVSEARKTAEELKDAFENGYWIGMLQ
ncbi:MAG: SPOR domain-containing protein [Ignavibacteriales bacterium]|nr:SPOR domain-containing protein [Ignavibacteriales bacterium]